MGEARVLQGVDVRGSAWVLVRPAGGDEMAGSGAATEPSVAQQLEQRYAEGLRDGRSAEVEKLDAEQQARIAREVDAALEEARRQGYAHGEAAARGEAGRAAAQAQREIERKVRSLEAVATALADQADAALDGIEDDLVGLCHDVICRILGATAATPAGIRALVLQALGELPGRPLAVHLHPDDLALVQGSGAERFDSRIRWVPDGSVASGGCIVKSEAGSIDARLETQLQALSAVLRQARLAQRAGRADRR